MNKASKQTRSDHSEKVVGSDIPKSTQLPKCPIDDPECRNDLTRYIKALLAIDQAIQRETPPVTLECRPGQHTTSKVPQSRGGCDGDSVGEIPVNLRCRVSRAFRGDSV